MNENHFKTYHITNRLEVAGIVLEASKLAKEIGFKSSMQNLIATIVSELAKNILIHANNGDIQLGLVTEKSIKGIEIFAQDNGPGIDDVEKAMQEHYSTKGSLGLGLPAVKRMADEFEIKTEIGKGTSITVRKWLTYEKN